jgi:hypothetical protein
MKTNSQPFDYGVILNNEFQQHSMELYEFLSFVREKVKQSDLFLLLCRQGCIMMNV